MSRIFLVRAALLLAGGCFGITAGVSGASERVKVEARALSASATPQSAWDSFTSALRQGKMREAYGMLCEDSRRGVSYRDFCVRWHPVSGRYRDVLQPPGFSEFRISGGVATLRFGITGNVVNEGRTAQAVLVNSGSGWQVLDGPDLGDTLLEAAARSTLTRLVKYSPLVRKALQDGVQVTVADLAAENPRLFEERSVKGFLKNYDITIDALRDGVVIATPRRKGLRGYRITLDGKLGDFSGMVENRLTGEELARIRERKQQEQKRQQEAILHQQQLAQQKALAAQQQRDLEQRREKTRLHQAALKQEVVASSSIIESVPDFVDPDKPPVIIRKTISFAQDEPVEAASTVAPEPQVQVPPVAEVKRPVVDTLRKEPRVASVLKPEAVKSSGKSGESQELLFEQALEQIGRGEEVDLAPVAEQSKPEFKVDLQMPELDDSALIRSAALSEKTRAAVAKEFVGPPQPALSQIELPDFVPMVPPENDRRSVAKPGDIPVAEVDLGNGVFVVKEWEFDGTAEQLLDITGKGDKASDGSRQR